MGGGEEKKNQSNSVGRLFTSIIIIIYLFYFFLPFLSILITRTADDVINNNIMRLILLIRGRFQNAMQTMHLIQVLHSNNIIIVIIVHSLHGYRNTVYLYIYIYKMHFILLSPSEYFSRISIGTYNNDKNITAGTDALGEYVTDRARQKREII